jgi:hypothetical protein
VTTGHVGCWPTSWVATARSRGCGPSTTSTLADRAFRFSSDPELEARVRDVVGLSLEPSAYAIVLWVDEKSQIQALDPTRLPAPTPALPPGDIGAEQRLTGAG